MIMRNKVGYDLRPTDLWTELLESRPNRLMPSKDVMKVPGLAVSFDNMPSCLVSNQQS